MVSIARFSCCAAPGNPANSRAKARRSAWLLGAVAVLFYVGYMVWIFIRTSSGG